MKKWFWLIVLLAGVVLPVHAQESIPISSPEDLAAIAENPGGDYILMEDLDMSGIDWIGPDFSGTLDGNGHSILNLTITGTGVSTAVPTAASRRSLDRVSVPMWPITLSGRLLIVALVGRYPTN